MLELLDTNGLFCGVTDVPVARKVAPMDNTKWRAKEIADGLFLIENGEANVYKRGSHCKCCALADVVADLGGRAETRGLHRYGGVGS